MNPAPSTSPGLVKTVLSTQEAAVWGVLVVWAAFLQMIKRNGNSSEEIRELKIVVINQFCMASTLSGPHITVHM